MPTIFYLSHWNLRFDPSRLVWKIISLMATRWKAWIPTSNKQTITLKLSPSWHCVVLQEAAPWYVHPNYDNLTPLHLLLQTLYITKMRAAHINVWQSHLQILFINKIFSFSLHSYILEFVVYSIGDTLITLLATTTWSECLNPRTNKQIY